MHTRMTNGATSGHAPVATTDVSVHAQHPNQSLIRYNSTAITNVRRIDQNIGPSKEEGTLRVNTLRLKNKIDNHTAETHVEVFPLLMV